MLLHTGGIECRESGRTNDNRNGATETFWVSSVLNLFFYFIFFNPDVYKEAYEQNSVNNIEDDIEYDKENYELHEEECRFDEFGL